MSELILSQPVFDVQRAAERASFDFGWLRTSHSFSFADYYDPRNVNWGALRVFNDDHVVGGKGFGTHPHRDMEIVTYVLSGQLEHRDSLGSHGVVGPGGVQFMSAGTGIQHSEFNHSATEELHFLQMWVLPGKLGRRSRNTGRWSSAPRSGTIRWLLVASGQPGLSAPVDAHPRRLVPRQPSHRPHAAAHVRAWTPGFFLRRVGDDRGGRVRRQRCRRSERPSYYATAMPCGSRG